MKAYFLSALRCLTRSALAQTCTAATLLTMLPAITPLGAAQAKVVDASLISMTGQISAVDSASRTLTVISPNGEALTMQARPGVHNVERIKVGDWVRLDYYESLAIATRPKGSGFPEVKTEIVDAHAQRGQMPQGAVGTQTTITAEIWHISHTTNAVVLQGPTGGRQTVIVHDPQAIAKLATLKVGDLVDFTFTRAIAGAVIAPTPAPTK